MTYRAKLSGSVKSFQVEPDQSLLEAALFQDVALPYGCQSGGCGACKARLLDGRIDYPYDPPALSVADKAAGYVLLCQAQPRSDVEIQVEELPDNHVIPVRTMPVRVEARELLCHDVMRLQLKLPKGEVFEFLPGQYVDILLRDGRRRSYSIASNPCEKGFIELHLRNVEGGEFSDFIFNSMQDRAILRLEGPLGGFYLRSQSERPMLFMAGGTGLAPIKSMLEQLIATSARRSVHLFWGARARRDLYLHTQLQSWAAEHDWLRYTPVLSEPQDEDQWQGACGFVHKALAQQYPELADYDVYISGPPIMVQAATARFSELGLPAEQLYFDSFDYAYQTWPDRETVTDPED